MATNPADRVRLTCPQCRQDVLVPLANLGKKGRCPSCQHVFLLVTTPTVPPDRNAELWSDLGTAGDTSQRPTVEAPHAALTRAITNDYLARAKNDEPYVKTEERQPLYRFMTSWGAVFGSTCLLLFGLVVFIFISMRIGVVMIIPAVGGIVQGINYIFYYRYLDSEGR